MSMNFPTNLKSLRRANKLTQVRLAKDTKLTRSMIASYEQGVAEPTFCNLVKIAQCLDVTLNELVL